MFAREENDGNFIKRILQSMIHREDELETFAPLYAAMHMIRQVWYRVTNTPSTRRTIHKDEHLFSRQKRGVHILAPTVRVYVNNASLFFMLSGITEAICYRHYHVNINLMTGNTIRCMDALASGNISDFIFLSSVVIFYILGGILFAKLLAWRIGPKFRDLPLISTGAASSSGAGTLQRRKMTTDDPNRIVSSFSFSLFATSDLIGYILGDKLKILSLALSFGVTNAVAYHMFGYVTHSVTGTYDAIGRLFVSHRRKHKVENGDADLDVTNVKSANATTCSRSRGADTILEEICYFLIGLLSTFGVCNFLESKPGLHTMLPPLGISLAFAHIIILSMLFSDRNSRVRRAYVTPSDRILGV